MSKEKPVDISAIAFDIETEGLPPQVQLDTFQPTFEPDARLTDPKKIEADLKKKLESWLEKAALDATRARVLVIGILKKGADGFSVMEGDEKEIIERFWAFFKFNPHNTFVGHFIKGFDLPFLIRRSYVHGIAVPSELFDGRYFIDRFVDTAEAWTRGTKDHISLDALSRALGLGKKNGNGADFAKLYATDKNAALNYLRNDCALARACAVKMGVAFE